MCEASDVAAIAAVNNNAAVRNNCQDANEKAWASGCGVACAWDREAMARQESGAA
jgi:hypothetical protein